MVKLIYTAITSLDGYVEDEDGSFGWSRPDEEVHSFVNDLERPAGTYLYGRRMYDTMASWEVAHTQPGHSPATLDYARIWQAAEKIVYSTTLQAASTARTRIERRFDPEAVSRMKAAASRNLTIGGANLAGQAIKAGLVDEVHLLINPVVVGGGKAALPGRVRADLDLLAERRFGSGVVHLHYRLRP
jgi:dihydrofolate reductase